MQPVPGPSPKLVVCDLDGTLIDSMPMVMAAFRHAVSPWKRWDDDAVLRGHLTRNYLHCLRALLPEGAPIEEAVGRLVDYSRGHEHEVNAFPEARSFLEAAGRRARIALWTNRDRASSLRHLGRLGLAPWVQELVCGDDFATHKPEPEGMLRLLERTGTDPRQAVFIGDADVDVEGGSRAGVPTLLIRNGVSFAGRIEALATRVFDNESDAYRHTLGLLG